jgi:hypothetical protein
LHDSISSFNKQKNNVINLKIDLTTRLLDVDQEIKEKIPTTKKITIITFILIAIMGVVVSTSFLI